MTHYSVVILSYRDKRTRDFAEGKRVKAFFSIQRSARLKLDRLEAATSIQDLAALPGNRFEEEHLAFHIHFHHGELPLRGQELGLFDIEMPTLLPLPRT